VGGEGRERTDFSLAPRPRPSLLPLAPHDQERDIVSKYLKIIQDEGPALQGDHRQAARIPAAAASARREQTDMGELVQVVLDMVQTLPSSKGKEVVFEPTEKITAWVNAQEDSASPAQPGGQCPGEHGRRRAGS